MPATEKQPAAGPAWLAFGDVNAFFGLMLDNLTGLILTVSLLHVTFAFPTEFALGHMIPGTAIGVLVGDLLFFWMGLELMRRSGRDDVTAMPLGLDTPSTFGMIFFVLGPSFLHARFTLGLSENDAATYTWHIGIWSIVWSGLFKLVCSLGSGWVRSVVPRAGLLGSLAAIALVLISFLPLLEILHFPVAGMLALAIILTTLIARVEFPCKIPGTVGALLVAGAVYYAMQYFGLPGYEEHGVGIEPEKALLPTAWLEAFQFGWLARWRESLDYLPIVIPFALATVIGGIDCTESAAAAGDEFDTGQVVAVEAVATLLAGFCGGVIQTTPYIGHPAYKAMGGRSGYTLATALFIGTAGLLGYFGYLYSWIPKPAVLPILVFVGLEITAQSFFATPRRHYAAVALACVPVMASLAMIFLEPLQGQYMGQVSELRAEVERLKADLPPALPRSTPDRAGDGDAATTHPPADHRLQTLETIVRRLEQQAGSPSQGIRGEPAGPLGKNFQTLLILKNGFILISLLWASLLAALIDRRLLVAATYCLICAACTLVGLIHSPMPQGDLINPLNLPATMPANAFGQTPYDLATGYAAVAVLLIGWHLYRRATGVVDEPLTAHDHPEPAHEAHP